MMDEVWKLIEELKSEKELEDVEASIPYTI